MAALNDTCTIVTLTGGLTVPTARHSAQMTALIDMCTIVTLTGGLSEPTGRHAQVAAILIVIHLTREHPHRACPAYPCRYHYYSR